MVRKTKRSLSQEEQDLWSQVVSSTTPISRPKIDELIGATRKPPLRQDQDQPLQSFHLGQSVNNTTGATVNLKPALANSLASGPVQMDKKSFTNMKRGKLKPEGRIDLHGMTLAQAHPALTSFVLNAVADGKRLVLVITGKGKDKPEYDFMPVQRGVLRHQVPQWLRMAPLSHYILQVSQSHIKHGGDGAYYVYLRRQR